MLPGVDRHGHAPSAATQPKAVTLDRQRGQAARLQHLHRQVTQARPQFLCARFGAAPRPGGGAGAALDELFSVLVQPSLVQPTFVIDHPREVSPLAAPEPGRRRLRLKDTVPLHRARTR